MSDDFVFLPKQTEGEVPAENAALAPEVTPSDQVAPTNEEQPEFSFLPPPPPEESTSTNAGYLGSTAAGAALGAFGKFKGVEPEINLKPGAGVFQAKPADVAAINDYLRVKLQDPTFDVTSGKYTPEEIHRLLQGGPGDPGNLTGQQREESYKMGQMRRSRTQKAIEANIEKNFPGTPDPFAELPEDLVLMKNGILAPASTATEIAQQRQAETLRTNQSALDEARANLERRAMQAGIGKMQRGAIAGGLAGAESYGMANEPESPDWMEYLSNLGNVGIYSRNPIAQRLGIAAKVPNITNKLLKEYFKNNPEAAQKMLQNQKEAESAPGLSVLNPQYGP